MATIYKSSELHLLQDNSHGYEDTWNFTRRAVEECVKLDTMLESNAQLAKDVVTASVSTVSFCIIIIHGCYDFYCFLKLLGQKHFRIFMEQVTVTFLPMCQADFQ